MTCAGIAELPGPARIKRLKGDATTDDQRNRKFHRNAINELWATDMTEHLPNGIQAREGRSLYPAGLDTCSRKMIDWAIGAKQDPAPVVNALNLAVRARHLKQGGIVHAVRFTSWVFTQ